MVRDGAVFLKRGRRPFFLDRLATNLQVALHRAAPELKLRRPYGRFLAVPIEDGARIADPDRVAQALADVFGVVWAGPCDIVEDPTIERLEAAVAAYAVAHRRRSHRTFRIATVRADKTFPIPSVECNRRLGSAVWVALGDVQVDLDTPDLTINVDIRNGIALITGGGVPGVGGLPVGSNGRALLLLSGGIDSPVAGWLTMKRGVALDAVTFLSPPYTGPQAREKVESLIRHLARWQRRLRLFVVPFAAIQEAYRDDAPGDQLVLLYRRALRRIADALARREGHQALVTGESIGQVASQTLPNLHCIAQVATRPVVRPLVTYDKVETIALARRIGTYETSILPFDDCCSLFVPRHPELRGVPVNLERIEARIGPGALEAEALAQAEVVTLD